MAGEKLEVLGVITAVGSVGYWKDGAYTEIRRDDGLTGAKVGDVLYYDPADFPNLMKPRPHPIRLWFRNAIWWLRYGWRS